MSLPPMTLHVSVAPRSGREWHVWLPLFLLWPLILAIGLVGLVAAVIADVVLALIGQRSRHCTSLLVHAFAAFAVARGTAVSFSTATSTVGVTVD